MSGIMSMLLGARTTIATAVDEFFNRVTLLLPGNGTNGAQNNTFLDSSTNNFTITRNGGNPGMTQGTFSPFSQTGWSNYFGATSAFLTPAIGAGQAFGTGDFTVELWLYASNSACNILLPSSGTSSWGLLTFNNQLYWQENGANLANAGTVTQNSWVHLAVSRTGGTLNGYVNGTRVFNPANTFNYSATPTRNLGPANGGGVPFYLSNVRIIKGTGLYSGETITVPMLPLTSVTNTELLTCNSNRFVDTNTQVAEKTITVNGSPSVQPFSPFAPTTAYSAATVGGSGYFDGTGDYLTTPSTNQFAPAGDFTVAWWYYPVTLQTSVMLANYTGNNTTDWSFETTSLGALNIYLNGSTVRITGGSNTLRLNQWHYIVVSRSGTTVTAYVNGSTIGTYTLSGTFGSASKTIRIGAGSAGTNNMFGYCSGVNLIDGTALSGTIPTAPPSSAGTSLCLNFTNAGVTDATAKNDLETLGNAQISTAQSRFGGSSIYFDGTGDYLTIAGNANLWLGAGDFTVEFWVYSPTPPSTSAAQYELVSFGTSGSTFRCFIFYASGSSTASAQIGIYSGATNIITVNSVIPQNTWTHVAVTRSGSGTGNVRFYINGTQNATTGTSTTDFNTGNLGIGAAPAGTNPAFVYIDDLRITKGFARYTSSFTAPTAAFPLQ